MDERDWLAQRFQEHRPRLRALAYRMLGSTSEADDALQEAWIRLSRSNAADAAHQQEQEEVVEAFLTAAREGEFDALLAVLDPHIVERVDTGSGTIVEVRGAENVARRAMAAASHRDGLVGRRALINGAPGWVSVLDGEFYAICALTVQGGRITTMDVLLDPDRLARLDLTLFDS
jgi:hypothetical protein